MKLAIAIVLTLLAACARGEPDVQPEPDAMPAECEMACEGSEDPDCVLYCMKCEEAALNGPDDAAQCCEDLGAVGPACE